MEQEKVRSFSSMEAQEAGWKKGPQTLVVQCDDVVVRNLVTLLHGGEDGVGGHLLLRVRGDRSSFSRTILNLVVVAVVVEN